MLLKDCFLLLSKGLESQNGKLGHIINLILASVVAGPVLLSMDQWGVLWSYVNILDDPLVIWNTVIIIITHLGTDRRLLGMSLERIVNGERLFSALSEIITAKTHMAPIEWYFINVVASFPFLEADEGEQTLESRLEASAEARVAASFEADGVDSSPPVPPVSVSVTASDVWPVVALACQCVSTERVFASELTAVLDQCQAGVDWLAMPTFKAHIDHLLWLFRNALRLALKPGSSRIGSPLAAPAGVAGCADSTVAGGASMTKDPDTEVLTQVCRLLMELMEVYEHCKYSTGNADGDTDTATGGEHSQSGAGHVSAIEARGLEAEGDWLGDSIDLASQCVCEFVRHHSNIYAFAATSGNGSGSNAVIVGVGAAGSSDPVPSLLSLSDTLQLAACGVEPGRQLVALECLRYHLLPIQAQARRAAAASISTSTGTDSGDLSVLTSHTEGDQAHTSPSSSSSKADRGRSSSSGRGTPASTRVNSAPLGDKQRSQSSLSSARGQLQSNSMRATKSKSKASSGNGRSPSPTEAQAQVRKDSSGRGAPSLRKATSTVGPAAVGVSLRKNANAAARGPNVVEEVCKTGIVRVLTWFLTHVSRRARELTCEILDTCMRADGYSVSVLYVNLMEQGLVPLLHLVRQGRECTNSISAPGAGNLFPEDDVRACAGRLVHHCQAYLSQFSIVKKRQAESHIAGIDAGSGAMGAAAAGVYISRLKNALIFSGNNKLKLNLFCAFLYLCMHSQTESESKTESETFMRNSSTDANSNADTGFVDVNRVLNLYGDPRGSMAQALALDNIQPQQGGTEEVVSPELPLFEQVLQGTVLGGSSSGPGNVVALYSFVAVIIHLFGGLVQRLEAETCDLSGQLAEKGPKAGDIKADRHRKPTVCIQSSPGSHGAPTGPTFVKMQCPVVDVLEREAYVLLGAMRELGDGDEGSGGVMLGSQSSSLLVERGLVVPRSAVHEGTEQSNAAVGVIGAGGSAAVVAFTFGLYPIWQEIFSHSVDTYLLDMGTRKMSLGSLLQCLAVARTYRMEALAEAYASIVAKKHLGSGSGGAGMEPLLKIFTAAFMDTNDGLFDPFDAGEDADLHAHFAASSLRATRARLLLGCLRYTLSQLEALLANTGYPSTRPGSQFLINQQNQQQLIRLIFRSLKLLLGTSGLAFAPSKSGGQAGLVRE